MPCEDLVCEWKTVVIDRLVINWGFKTEHLTNAQQALNDLIEREVEYALDPLISLRARDLIEKGKNVNQDSK
jgi:hypothetical protein